MASNGMNRARGDGAASAENAEFPIKVDRNVYPRPEYQFPNARIGITVKDSQADFPMPHNAPPGSPNVLLIILDDVGYGWMNTFGGLIESPTLDRLAKRGLRYCQFHTTALCSPTRAALLTGRNHHSVSSGVIQELATGFPGYTGIIPQSCATVAEVLHQNGYATGWWGKNHNVPDNQTSPAGPFDRWPEGLGFDYFYGFIGGETDQFYPALYRGNKPAEANKTPEDGYQLTRDLADDCIAWMRQQKSIAPDRPFFAYFAPGAAHAPHQPPLDWRGRHAGKFDMGWDEYRRLVHERQLELGVIPKDTKLTPRPSEIPAWDDHNPEEKRLFSRFMENYADFVEHTDYEIGRVIDALEGMGEFDNTLVFYIIGDNGSSAEGSLIGTINEFLLLNGFQPKLEDVLPRIDEIGLPGTSPHYPVGWAWAGDTPFQWMKQIASHFGGTRNPMVVSWPRRISDAGGVRFQFHHVIDVAPTILEVVGIREPSMVNGAPQKPIEGVSLAYTFGRDRASTPSKHYIQYFEMFGNRALYYDGWIACCRHGRLPWQNIGSTPFENDRWELYNIDQDFSESDDLAARYPEKLRELQDHFFAEAAKHDVLPLDDRWAERAEVSTRPNWFRNRKRVRFYPGMVRLPEGSAPPTINATYTITVAAEIPGRGAEGVLVCVGGVTGGWSLYVKDGKLVYHFNFYDTKRYEAVSNVKVPTGKVELKVEYINETNALFGPATVRLAINGAHVGETRIEAQGGRFSLESLDVGVDTLSPVSNTYPKGKPGFPFTGSIEHVTFEYDGDAVQMTPAQKLELTAKMD